MTKNKQKGAKAPLNFFQKSIDKHFPVCYNIIRKNEREETKMAREQRYMDKETGEIVFTHAEAMELFRQGHNIELWYLSETLGEWVCGVEWEH